MAVQSSSSLEWSIIGKSVCSHSKLWGLVCLFNAFPSFLWYQLNFSHMPKIGKNTKGNDVIEHENFLYKYHKPLNSTKNRHRWVCTNVYKKCSAYAYTIGRKIPICFELKNEHTCANPFKSSSNDVKSSELEVVFNRGRVTHWEPIGLLV
uniref:Uncharacterized protein n=1 Tax=Meloidogyne incognita TaxID=6306 RepID=A0A914L977_MELIC